MHQQFADAPTMDQRIEAPSVALRLTPRSVRDYRGNRNSLIDVPKAKKVVEELILSISMRTVWTRSGTAPNGLAPQEICLC
jgi:hypothetical protein